MLANLLKSLFGNPSAPQENSNKQPLNADEAEDVAEKNALIARMKPDGEYFASKQANTLSQPSNNIVTTQETQTAPLEKRASKNDAPPQVAQPEQPLNKSEDHVAPQKQQTAAISHKQFGAKVDTTIETANYFYEVIRKAVADERGLHVETAIITGARLCGSLLYRSIPVDSNRKYASPGTTILNPEIDKRGREMEAFLTTTLTTLGVHFDASIVKKKMSQRPVNDILGHSRLPFMEIMEKIQPFCLSFCEITGDYRQGAAAAIVATAILIRDAASILDVNDAVIMAAMGMVEGGKTVPPLGNTKDEKIHAEKPTDPINHFKSDGETLYYLVKDYLEMRGGLDLPSLFCALGALAGQTCLQYALAEYQLQKIPTTKEIPTNEAKLTKEKSLFAFNVKSSGQDYFFGDLLNHPLCESRYSIWNVVQFYLKQLDHQFEFDVHEVFDYVAKNIGEQKFGMLRLPMQYMPRELPIFYLKQIWPSAAEALTNISPNKTDWHYILGGALFHAIHMHKQDSGKLHPALIAKIVMESAVPMSKVPIEPNIALGNYIVNRQPIH